MKLTGFIVVIVAALMFLVPSMKNEKRFERQAQEESPIEQLREQPNTYRVLYRAESPEENPVVDIHWMKRAAEVALDAGIPYFNVLDQEIREESSEANDSVLAEVEGVIQLDNDPMKAEFDAYEIQALILKDDIE